MKMIELIGGFLVGGVTGVALKDKILGNTQNDAQQRALDNLYAENEKFSRRNKELERQVEDLLAELNKIRKKSKEADDEQIDLEDDLDKAKRELKNIRFQNEELTRKLKEYKVTCETQAAEISLLKEKLG
jgi:hypothetical protein